jgi:hypothetical protein
MQPVAGLVRGNYAEAAAGWFSLEIRIEKSLPKFPKDQPNG